MLINVVFLFVTSCCLRVFMNPLISTLFCMSFLSSLNLFSILVGAKFLEERRFDPSICFTRGCLVSRVVPHLLW